MLLPDHADQERREEILDGFKYILVSSMTFSTNGKKSQKLINDKSAEWAEEFHLLKYV